MLVILMTSCKKTNERKCFKSWGEESEITLELNDFTSLEVNDNMIVYLYQDTINNIKISGGKNVIEWVEIENNSNQLILSNGNTCKFLRSFKKKIYIELHYKNIDHILYTGGEELVMKNTNTSDQLSVNFVDGGGTIHCDIDATYFELILTGGAGNFFVKGKSESTYLNVRTNGYGDAQSLLSETLIVNNTSSGNIIATVRDSGKVHATINYSGNNHIHGTPSEIELVDNGEGQNVLY